MVPQKIWKLLDDVGCDDVYQFLGVDDDASIEDLRAAAEKKYISIHNQSSRSDAARAAAALAGLCRSDVFKSARSKAAYDREAARRGAKSRGEPPPAIPWYLNAADKALPILARSSVLARSILARSAGPARFIFEFWKARTLQMPFIWGFINMAGGIALAAFGQFLMDLGGFLGNLLAIPTALIFLLGSVLLLYGMLLLSVAFVLGWLLYLLNYVKRFILPFQVLQCQSCEMQASRIAFAQGGLFECPSCGTDLPPVKPIRRRKHPR